MGRVLDHIDDVTAVWIARRRRFFIATSPADDGWVDLSSKGLDSSRVLGPTRIAYVDLTGSGAETVAHLRNDGCVTVMFCACDGPPRARADMRCR